MKFNNSPWNSVAIAVAVWLAALTLRPLFVNGEFLTWVPAMAGTAAVVGALGVVVRFPRIVTLVVQAVAMAGLLLWLGLRQAPSPPAAEHPWYQPLILLGQLGTSTIRTSATPLPTDPGLVWLLLCVLALVVVATEVLVNGLEQPAWSLAPLGVVYGVGALTLPTEMEFASFALIAVGYALVLVTSTRLAGANRSSWTTGPTRLGIAIATLLVAMVLTPMLTNLVPLGQKQPWLQAGANKPIELSDPKIALSENLRRPSEQVVLRYSTDSETPVYLRTVALTRLSTSGAELTGMQLSTTGLAGTYTFPGREVETSVRMLMSSEYLPVPFAVDRFSANGDWAHDRDTMSIVATGNARTEQTTGLEYEVASTVPDPDRAEVEEASAGTDLSTDTVSVPTGLDPKVVTLTDSVTAEATTDGEKALAIQSFLRSEKFTYSLDAPDTAGMDNISDFLLADNSGYCIHFAAGMITMARLQEIPARMAIGFAPGTRDGDEWVVTTHNMHAWPELYFEELGWVPFEPTKSVAGPPEYTDPDSPTGASPTPSVSPSQSDDPSSPSSTPAEASDEPTVSPKPPTDASDGFSPTAWWLLLGLGVLVAVPFASRTLMRQWRLRPGQASAAAAETAWREVQALFIDAGLEWNDSSPILATHELGERLEPAVAAQLGAIANTVERARYARGGADTSDLSAHVRDFRRNLLVSQTRHRQMRTLLLPSSLLPSRMG